MALRIALFTLVVIGVVNFAVYVIVWSQLGDAFAGHAADGRYFLSEHGRQTEVTRTAFAFNAAHSASLLVTHALALASALVLRWIDWRHGDAQERAVDAMLFAMRGQPEAHRLTPDATPAAPVCAPPDRGTA